MRRLILCCAILFLATANMHLQAQEETQENDSLMEQQTDITDIARRILKKPPKQESAEKASVAILPILGYNPSFGFNVGINIVADNLFGTV